MAPLAQIRSQGFLQISGRTEIYRYLGIDAALNSIINKRLRFTQLRGLEDPWEGVLGTATIESHRDHDRELWAEHGHDFSMPDDGYALHQAKNRVFNYASSWTINDPENMVMWKAFTLNTSSCCLISTVDELRHSFSRDIPMISVGSIDYSHHHEVPAGSFNLDEEVWRKRKAFEYEKEIRFVIDKINDSQSGNKLMIDEDRFVYEEFNPEAISRLVIHPHAPQGTIEYLRKIINEAIPAISIENPRISQLPNIDSL